MRFFNSSLVFLAILIIGLSKSQAQVAPVSAKSIGINTKNITIARDQYGVPHIKANTNPEAAYGLGWAICEDNFHNVQELLLVAKRMMGLSAGKDGAAADYFGHFIRAEEQVPEDYLTRLSPDYVAYQNGYIAAINDYAASHPKEVRVKGLFPATLKETLIGYVIVFANACHIPKALRAAMAGKPDKFYYVKEEGIGSNAMAYSSLKTKDGKTRLVINPHLPLEGAATFFECHILTDQGMNIHGGVFPGASAPGLGVTPNLGWSHTSNWPDCVDIYRLKLDPKNKNRYLYNGEWKTLEKRDAKLKVKLGALKITVNKPVYWSQYGPAVIAGDSAFALRYSLRNSWRAGEEWYKRCLAKNLTEFKNAMKLHAITSFNTIYADKEDNIFYFFGTNLPKRHPKYDWQKCVPGDTSATCHTEIYEVEELPWVMNPKCGYVYNTNNTPLKATCEAENIPADKYPHNLGLWWNHENNRDLRFRELIAKYDRVDDNDIREIKNDQCYPRNPAAGIYKVFNVVRGLKTEQYPDIADALKLMQDWDLCGRLDNTRAGFSLVVMYRLFNKYHYGFAEIESGFTPPVDDLIAMVRKTKPEFLKAHGKLDPPFSQVQFQIREGKIFSLGGLPEVLAPTYSNEIEGMKLKAEVGENYIGYATFGKNGLEKYETIVPFGASVHPESPHYADQAELYRMQKTKPIELDWNVFLNDPKVKKYNPGN